MGNRDIAATAEAWMHTHGHVSHASVDCSHFVTDVLKEALGSFSYLEADKFASSPEFIPVDTPERGDLVHWPGHIAIVIDPQQGTFIGSQSSTGVDIANWKTNPYWSGRTHRTYLRYNGR